VPAAFADITLHSASFTDLGGGYTVNLSGDASGLGTTDLVGTIVFSGDVQYTCQNKGGSTAPGQPLHITQPFSQSARTNPKNGRATINLTASFSPPATVPGDEIGCPNGNWKGINPVVVGPVSATGTLTAGSGGPTLFQQTISDVTP
jgi:hypothetical protein